MFLTFCDGWKSRKFAVPSSRSVKSLVSCEPNRIRGLAPPHSGSIKSLKFIGYRNSLKNKHRLKFCAPMTDVKWGEVVHVFSKMCCFESKKKIQLILKWSSLMEKVQFEWFVAKGVKYFKEFHLPKSVTVIPHNINTTAHRNGKYFNRKQVSTGCSVLSLNYTKLLWC